VSALAHLASSRLTGHIQQFTTVLN